jgi:hypothetical protein
MNSKNLILKSTLGAFLTGALLLSSCGKKAEIETAANNEEATAQNKEEGDAVGNETQNIADAAANSGLSVVGRLSSSSFNEISEAGQCATITHDTTITPKLVIIDFGTTNCLCNDNRMRRGKILVTYTGGRYKDIGSVKTVTFENFYRNDNKIEGTRIVSNKGLNDNQNYHWEVKETNMKITKVDGKFHTWNSTRDREMLAGYSTIAWSDDEYQMTGNADGINQNNIAYTASITTPLHRIMTCKWIDKGVIEFVNEANGKIRTIDYGTGNCDNLATVTVTTKRGKTISKTINLK